MHTFNWPDYLLWFGACCLLLCELILIAGKHNQRTNNFTYKNLAGVKIWFLLWVVCAGLTTGWGWYSVAVLAATLYDIAKYALGLLDLSNDIPLDGKVARVCLLLAVFQHVPT